MMSQSRIEWSEHLDDSEHTVEVAWGEVERLLGRRHEGTPEDDETLVRALLDSGAPEWVRDAEGMVTELGWVLIGPMPEED